MRVRADENLLSCTVEAVSDTAVVRISGQLGLATAPSARMALLKTLTAQPVSVVIDLTGLTVREDIALTVFSAFARTAGDWPGCPVRIAAPDPSVRDALNRLGIDRLAPVHGDRQAALEAVAALRTPRRYQQRFQPTLAAPVSARRLVVGACLAWQLDYLADDAELMITELVTNAMRYASGDIDVSITLRDRFVHLSVRDNNPQRPVRVLPDPDNGEGGRGLLLLDAIAAGWGTTVLPGGKAVWATLRIRR